jgi:hypothetical protein
MESISELKTVLSGTEKEKASIELKSCRKLFPTAENKKESSEDDLPADFSAMANRFGGKFVFGVNNDGTFEPKGSVDIDKAKQKIHQLCMDRVSPVIDCTITYLEDEDSDVLIVYIPKKGKVPHAVVRRESSEIKSRTYYIRTTSGKRLVSDAQLAWLFQEQYDPDFMHQFRFAFEWIGLEDIMSMEGLRTGYYSFGTFYQGLPADVQRTFRTDTAFAMKMTIELIPFIVLKSIMPRFTLNWHIGTQESFGYFGSGPMNDTQPFEHFDLAKIETRGPSSIFVGDEFRKHLATVYDRPICLPVGSTMFINYPSEHHSEIHIDHPDFNFCISFHASFFGHGMHKDNPYRKSLYSSPWIKGYEVEQSRQYRNMDGVCSLEMKFNFPDQHSDRFQKYFDFGKNLKLFVDREWNYDVALANSPNGETVVVNDKLDRILGHFGDGWKVE